jgi:hypothetical protein
MNLIDSLTPNNSQFFFLQSLILSTTSQLPTPHYPSFSSVQFTTIHYRCSYLPPPKDNDSSPLSTLILVVIKITKQANYLILTSILCYSTQSYWLNKQD